MITAERFAALKRGDILYSVDLPRLNRLDEAVIKKAVVVSKKDGGIMFMCEVVNNIDTLTEPEKFCFYKTQHIGICNLFETEEDAAKLLLKKIENIEKNVRENGSEDVQYTLQKIKEYDAKLKEKKADEREYLLNAKKRIDSIKKGLKLKSSME